jgi:hypothetical protein
VLSNMGDAGVAVGIDEVVVVEGGRVVVAVSRVIVVADVDVCGMGCVDGLAAMGMVNKWHHFFIWVCKHDEWSMCSLRVYKPLLFVFFPLCMSQYYFILVIIPFHYR